MRDLREVRRIEDVHGQVLSVAANPLKGIVVVMTAGESPPILNFSHEARKGGKDLVTDRLLFMPVPITLNWGSVRWSPDGESMYIGGIAPLGVILTPCEVEEINVYFKSCDGKTTPKRVVLGRGKYQAGMGTWSMDGKAVFTATLQGEFYLWNAVTGDPDLSVTENISRLSKDAGLKYRSVLVGH